MSTKQRLAEAIAALPDTLSEEEAVERLYRMIKIKQALKRNRSPSDEHVGASASSDLALIHEIAHHCAALPDLDLRPPEEILGYDDRGLF